MPRPTLLVFFLLLSLASNGCFSQQQRSQRPQCNLERIIARDPTIRIPSEAGSFEFWDSNAPELDCVGVEVERATVQPKGLLLPHYINAAKAYFAVQGRAIHGTVVSGCAETLESPVQGRQQGQSSVDYHQKLVRVTQGDVVAEVVGQTNWIYNDGNEPFVLIAVNDIANQANQLDRQLRRFWLAGNSQNQAHQEQGHGQGQKEQQGQGQHGQQGQGQQGQGQHGQGQGQQGQGQRQQQGQQDWAQYDNVWNGFDDELLSEILRLPQEIIRKLKGQQNNRKGGIVRAENLQLSLPEKLERQQQQQQQQGSESGSESEQNCLGPAICSLKIRENIAHPARADIYNPRAGRVGTVNSQTLPVMNLLGLSALHANLYSNALWAPSWTSNANTVLYIIRGNARVQIVGATGNAAFNGEVRQGQVIVVPQNFVVLKKAGNQGIEFIAFKTNDNAQTNSLAGRLSAIRSLPEDIVSVSFRIPREQTQRLKYGREEALLLSGS